MYANQIQIGILKPKFQNFRISPNLQVITSVWSYTEDYQKLQNNLQDNV